jgi:hypothetical protein
MDYQTTMSKARDYTWSRYEFYKLEVERLAKDVELKNIGAITLEQLQGQFDYAMSNLEMYTLLFCLIEKDKSYG